MVESTPKKQMNAEFVRNLIRILQTLTRILTAKAGKTDDRRICQESEQISARLWNKNSDCKIRKKQMTVEFVINLNRILHTLRQIFWPEKKKWQSFWPQKQKKNDGCRISQKCVQNSAHSRPFNLHPDRNLRNYGLFHTLQKFQVMKTPIFQDGNLEKSQVPPSKSLFRVQNAD